MMTVDIKGLREAVNLLRIFPQEAHKAQLRAINRAAAHAKTAAILGVIDTYTIMPSAVAKDLFLFRASNSNPVAMLRASGRPRALGNFKVTPGFMRVSPDSGFMTEVLRGESAPLSRDYFWLEFGSSGFASLFRRTGKGRIDFDPAYSPSTPQMVGHPKVQARIEEATRETLERIFAQNMNKALSGITA